MIPLLSYVGGKVASNILVENLKTLPKIQVELGTYDLYKTV